MNVPRRCPTPTGEICGLTLRNLAPANVARAAIEGVLWSLAYGVEVLREQTGSIDRIVLTGGAAQSEATRRIAPAVFGLPVAVTEPMESVAVGAARQAAWALTGSMPDWPVSYVGVHEPSAADLEAAAEIRDRYVGILTSHYTSR